VTLDDEKEILKGKPPNLRSTPTLKVDETSERAVKKHLRKVLRASE